jgi:hypothetical protein
VKKAPLSPAIPTGKPQTSYGQQIVNAVRGAHVKAAAKAAGATSKPVPARFAAALSGATPTKPKKRK